jgi:hypothetical protein
VTRAPVASFEDQRRGGGLGWGFVVAGGKTGTAMEGGQVSDFLDATIGVRWTRILREFLKGPSIVSDGIKQRLVH